MNLITKLAYNALTKTIQAIAPGGVSIPLATSEAGTYTPALTNTTAISASTAFASQYMRVGKVVTVSMKVNITASGGNSRLRLSLPFAPNFTAVENAAGVGSPVGITTEPPAVYAVASSDLVEYAFNTSDTSSRSHYLTFTYKIA